MNVFKFNKKHLQSLYKNIIFLCEFKHTSSSVV